MALPLLTSALAFTLTLSSAAGVPAPLVGTWNMPLHPQSLLASYNPATKTFKRVASGVMGDTLRIEASGRYTQVSAVNIKAGSCTIETYTFETGNVQVKGTQVSFKPSSSHKRQLGSCEKRPGNVFNYATPETRTWKLGKVQGKTMLSLDGEHDEVSYLKL